MPTKQGPKSWWCLPSTQLCSPNRTCGCVCKTLVVPNAKFQRCSRWMYFLWRVGLAWFQRWHACCMGLRNQTLSRTVFAKLSTIWLHDAMLLPWFKAWPDEVKAFLGFHSIPIILNVWLTILGKCVLRSFGAIHATCVVVDDPTALVSQTRSILQAVLYLNWWGIAGVYCFELPFL